MKYTIHGSRYDETAIYYKWDRDRKFPEYTRIESAQYEVEANCLDEAEDWLIENHPEFYMGCSITNEKGDFLMTPIPCCEYGYGNFETEAARIAYVRSYRR